MASDRVRVASGGGRSGRRDGSQGAEVDVGARQRAFGDLGAVDGAVGDLAGGDRFCLELARADRVLAELDGGEGGGAGEKQEQTERRDDVGVGKVLSELAIGPGCLVLHRLSSFAFGCGAPSRGPLKMWRGLMVVALVPLFLGLRRA